MHCIRNCHFTTAARRSNNLSKINKRVVAELRIHSFGLFFCCCCCFFLEIKGIFLWHKATICGEGTALQSEGLTILPYKQQQSNLVLALCLYQYIFNCFLTQIVLNTDCYLILNEKRQRG